MLVRERVANWSYPRVFSRRSVGGGEILGFPLSAVHVTPPLHAFDSSLSCPDSRSRHTRRTGCNLHIGTPLHMLESGILLAIQMDASDRGTRGRPAGPPAVVPAAVRPPLS